MYIWINIGDVFTFSLFYIDCNIFAFIPRDCVDGVGFDTLHKAYQILSNIEDDEVEVFYCKFIYWRKI